MWTSWVDIPDAEIAAGEVPLAQTGRRLRDNDLANGDVPIPCSYSGASLGTVLAQEWATIASYTVFLPRGCNGIVWICEARVRVRDPKDGGDPIPGSLRLKAGSVIGVDWGVMDSARTPQLVQLDYPDSICGTFQTIELQARVDPTGTLYLYEATKYSAAMAHAHRWTE